jgi:hypothetical protein
VSVLPLVAESAATAGTRCVLQGGALREFPLDRPANRKSQVIYASRGQVDSLNSERHIEFIIEPLERNRKTLEALRAVGWKVDIFVLWVSRSGHGGPKLSPRTMAQLASLEIEVGFDIYFDD